jgi:hypothetical protein
VWAPALARGRECRLGLGPPGRNNRDRRARRIETPVSGDNQILVVEGRGSTPSSPKATDVRRGHQDVRGRR